MVHALPAADQQKRHPFHQGIVGPDDQGRLWMLGRRSGVDELCVATVPDWEDVTVDGELETSKGTSVVRDGDILRVKISGQCLNNSGANVDNMSKVRLRGVEKLSTGVVTLTPSVNPHTWHLTVELHVNGTTFTVLAAKFNISRATTVALATGGDGVSGVASPVIAEGTTTPLSLR